MSVPKGYKAVTFMKRHYMFSYKEGDEGIVSDENLKKYDLVKKGYVTFGHAKKS